MKTLNMEEKMNLWLSANAKCISISEFEEQVGMSFNDFTEQYKIETRKRWRRHLGVNEPVKKEPTCNCNEEKVANAVRGKNTTKPVPVCIFRCPIHGETLTEVDRHSEQSLKILGIDTH